jgi:hypothetical protein
LKAEIQEKKLMLGD